MKRYLQQLASWSQGLRGDGLLSEVLFRPQEDKWQFLMPTEPYFNSQICAFGPCDFKGGIQLKNVYGVYADLKVSLLNSSNKDLLRPQFTTLVNMESQKNPVYSLLSVIAEEDGMARVSIFDFMPRFLGQGLPAIKIDGVYLNSRSIMYLGQSNFFQVATFGSPSLIARGTHHMGRFDFRKDFERTRFLKLAKSSQNVVMCSESDMDPYRPNVNQMIEIFGVVKDLPGKTLGDSRLPAPLANLTAASIQDPTPNRKSINREFVSVEIFLDPPQRNSMLSTWLYSKVRRWRKEGRRIEFIFVRFSDLKQRPSLRIRIWEKGSRGRRPVALEVLADLSQFFKKGLIRDWEPNHFEPEVSRYLGPAGVRIFERYAKAESNLLIKSLDFRRALRQEDDSLALAIALVGSTTLLNTFYQGQPEPKQKLLRSLNSVLQNQPPFHEVRNISKEEILIRAEKFLSSTRGKKFCEEHLAICKTLWSSYRKIDKALSTRHKLLIDIMHMHINRAATRTGEPYGVPDSTIFMLMRLVVEGFSKVKVSRLNELAERAYQAR
ncbi:MAG: thiopeptide-type bacteriocin biosynthesis protein [Bdellovibrionales bacterium]